MKQINLADGRKYAIKQYDRAPEKAKLMMDLLVGDGRKSGWVLHVTNTKNPARFYYYAVLSQDSKGRWQIIPWATRDQLPATRN